MRQARGRTTRALTLSLVAFAAALTVCGVAHAGKGPESTGPVKVSKDWVVLLNGAGRDALINLPRLRSVESARVVPNAYILKLNAAVDHAAAWRMLEARKGGTIKAFDALLPHQHVRRAVPNDTMFGSQWHLSNTGQNTGATVGADANVLNVWNSYNGAGVKIAVVDDGVQIDHPDLAPNYSSAISWDFNYGDGNPSPDLSTDGHGTAAAGVAAARGGNALGVSGAAPMATLGGIRLISGATTDLTDSKALSYQRDQVDIYSNSWGPQDNATLAGPGPLTKAVLEDGAKNGRNGKGNIFVWAGGNGGDAGDNVNYDGYANSRHTIAVAAIDDRGIQSSYSEPGAPLLVSAYSNSSGRPGITTTDRTGSAGYTSTDYTTTFGGTSSATPLVSGVVALMLQANPNLTSRDVQHILVNTAEKNDATGAGWTTNGAGHDVNHRYGFGAVDAGAAVAAAETWTNVAAEVEVESAPKSVGVALNDFQTVTDSITVTDNVRIEWVEIDFDARHTYRGDLAIELISPSGTSSILSELHADPGDNYDWTFTSARHWDEFSAGLWTLNVSDLGRQDIGTWDSWQLNFFGTAVAVPEPTALGLFALSGVALLRRRK